MLHVWWRSWDSKPSIPLKFRITDMLWKIFISLRGFCLRQNPRNIELSCSDSMWYYLSRLALQVSSWIILVTVTGQQLFAFFESLWSLNFPRILTVWTMPRKITEVLLSWKEGGAGLTRVDRWRIVSACTQWTIWKERNFRCFEDVAVQFRGLSWTALDFSAFSANERYIEASIKDDTLVVC